MDKILDRICSIRNHPISTLDDKFRHIYIEGLAASMFSISKGNQTAQMLTLAWAHSICPQIKTIDSIWRDNNDSVKKAISIQRKGFKFFTMRKCLFFDVLYLAESSLIEKFSIDEIILYLQKDVCGFFSRRTLDRVSLGYKASQTQVFGIDPILLRHKKDNETRLSSKEKRVLVVANISAGKSTLINALVGRRVNKTLTTICTQKLVYLHNKPVQDGFMVQDSKYKYTYYPEECNVDSDEFVHASFKFDSLLSKFNLYYIDTPGINNAYDSSHRELTESAIIGNEYDCLLYVSNCQYNATNDEDYILSLLKSKCKRPVIFVLNQMDKMKKKNDSVTKMLNDFYSDLVKKGFIKPTIIPTSAQAALLFKLSDTALDEDDLFERDLFKKKFNEEYYDLPSYTSKQKSKNHLESTGIPYLERTIQNFIK